jgi:hypothetical protein
MAKTKRNNFYTLAIWFAALLSLAFILPIIILHCVASGGLLPEWVLALIYGPFFISQEVAGAGYIGKWADFLTGEKKLSQFAREIVASWKDAGRNFISRINAENIGLTIGIAIGVTVTIAQAALHCTVPFAGVVSNVLAGGLFCLANINDFGGLGNRLGRTIDYFFGKSPNPKSNIFRKQNVNYALAIVAGVLIGAALATAALIVSAASMGVVPGILFTVTAVGACASSSGYIGRCADFFLGERTAVHAIKDNFNPLSTKPMTSFKERCSKENIGTAIGVTAGMVVASVLIGLGIVSLPFFGIGLPKILLGVFLMATLVGSSGGLGNRLGHAIDKYTGRKSLGIDDELERENKNNSPAYSKHRDHSPDNSPRPSQQVANLYPSLRLKPSSLSINADDTQTPLFPAKAIVEQRDNSIGLPRQDKLWKETVPSTTTYQKHGMFKLPKPPITPNYPIKVESALRTSICAAAA